MLLGRAEAQLCSQVLEDILSLLFPSVSNILRILIMGSKDSNEKMLQKILTKVEKLDSIEKAIDDIKSSLVDLNIRIDDVEVEQSELHAKIEKLEQQRDEDSNRARRKNLIFHGIDEGKESESYEDCKKILTQFLGQFDIRLHSDYSIERAHRLGRKVSGRSRPLIALFSFFEEKELILKHRRDFKAKGFDVTGDYSKWSRDARRALYPIIDKAKKDGKRTVLRMYDAYVDDKIYSYDRRTNSVKEKVTESKPNENRGRGKPNQNRVNQLLSSRPQSRSTSRKRSTDDGSSITKYFKQSDENARKESKSQSSSIPQMDGAD